MTTVQDEERVTGDAQQPGEAGRRRVVQILVALLAVAMLLTGILGIGKLPGFQVVLDFVAAAVLAGLAVLVPRGAPRWALVLVSWASALGVIAEFGDYQAVQNDTGALAATNTTYFLPVLLWPYMAALLVVAIVITVLSKVRKQH